MPDAAQATLEPSPRQTRDSGSTSRERRGVATPVSPIPFGMVLLASAAGFGDWRLSRVYGSRCGLRRVAPRTSEAQSRKPKAK